jgi:hypothetical protein
MAAILKDYVEGVVDVMREHVVVFGADPDTERVFRRVKDTNWLIRYTIVGGNNLVVTGDLGCAVYTWCGRISFPFLGECNLSYLLSKCNASEWGREAAQWNGEEAARGLAWHVSQMDREQKEAWRALREDVSRRELNEAMSSHESWAEFADLWLRHVWDDLDGIWGIGWVVPRRAIAHCCGLQLMHERRAARKA